MKRFSVLLIVGFAACAALAAQSVIEDREIKTLESPDDGRAKLGLLLGNPSAATFGYSLANWFELNFNAGYNFKYDRMAYLGLNSMFTFVNISIGDAGVMPLSAGPQMNFIFGTNFQFEVVANLRLEYTFETIPLNLFVEGGVGVGLNARKDSLPYPAWNAGLGVRYVF